MLSESSETAARSTKCFPNPRKQLRVPQNAFRILGNFCALREMPSESSKTAARSAKSFPNPRKSPRIPRSPSRILGNLHALREMPSEPSETFTLSKTKGSPRSLNHPNLCEGSPPVDLNLTLKNLLCKMMKIVLSIMIHNQKTIAIGRNLPSIRNRSFGTRRPECVI